MVKKQHRFFIFAQSFEPDLNIYVFICKECCNQIITQPGKIKLSQRSLPKKVVTNVVAQALGFSGGNFCWALGGNFCQALGFGDFLMNNISLKRKQRVDHSLKILISALTSS